MAVRADQITFAHLAKKRALRSSLCVSDSKQFNLSFAMIEIERLRVVSISAVGAPSFYFEPVEPYLYRRRAKTLSIGQSFLRMRPLLVCLRIYPVRLTTFLRLVIFQSSKSSFLWVSLFSIVARVCIWSLISLAVRGHARFTGVAQLVGRRGMFKKFNNRLLLFAR